MFGHDSDKIFDYGYSFAKVCLQSIIDLKKQASLIVANGIGLAFSTDNHAVKRFMRDK